MFEVTIRGHFAASHILNGYQGKCQQLHGHTWKVELVVAGRELNAIGLLVDFVEAKAQLHRILEELDHRHLNDLPAFQETNPSTENLAQYIFSRAVGAFVPLSVLRVTVFESDKASVTYYPDTPSS